MDRGVIGAIYWKLHTAYLKNDRKVADTMLGMLLDEDKTTPLTKALGVHHERFERIRASMASGYYGRLYGFGEPTPSLDPYASKEASGPETDFHKSLMSPEGSRAMFACLGISLGSTIVHELEMSPYGRCDFLVREGRKWHCVEVKMGEAKSSVVSQIDKYRLSTELDMCLGLHDQVQAAVIAESFSPYVASELSRLSVMMVTHSGTPDSLRKV